MQKLKIEISGNASISKSEIAFLIQEILFKKGFGEVSVNHQRSPDEARHGMLIDEKVEIFVE